MPAYRYEAIDLAGTVSKGVINADSPRSARSDLRGFAASLRALFSRAASSRDSGDATPRGCDGAVVCGV